jgi:hypothetical protein
MYTHLDHVRAWDGSKIQIFGWETLNMYYHVILNKHGHYANEIKFLRLGMYSYYGHKSLS